ncbi:probable polygalacturonase At3g15720 [Syzygium oleosum]|uniref:probable polygalacturonase At3g15720 n=1 Tax=Syzygium oleosum TaxID=219896 RepID=UPI0024BA61AD|nr:probable polygalacturonase At3g15720 [Syzygium oleosum]
MTFFRMENLQVSGLTSVDSPRAHIRIQNCTSVKLTALQIEAPDESPNTDGIAIAASSYVQILDSTIGTGDDCISIKGGTSFIDIAGVKCGPGHGISIGSLGYEGAYDTVEEVNVRNCVIKSAQNGVRIKTWEGGSGYVRGIHFEDIIISKAKNPIIIDQNYCDNQKRSCKVASPVVKVSDVTYRNVRGTSWNQPSITLMCARGTGCTNIVLDHINLNSAEPGEKSYAECKNVVNATFTSVDPPVSCQTS